MNSLWDIRIFLGLVPKESPCITQAFLPTHVFGIINWFRFPNSTHTKFSGSIPDKVKYIRYRFALTHAMKAYRGNGCTAPPILNLNTRCEWTTSCPGHCSPGNELQYRLNDRLGGPHSRYGRFGEEINISLLAGFQPRIVHIVRLITVETELRRLSNISPNALYM